MSDHAQVLAFKIDGHAAMERAAEALAWLAERGIIEPLPSDCGLGALAHRPGPKVLDAVKSPPEKGGYFDFRKGRTNGMEVHASMRATLQMGGESMPSFRCPTRGSSTTPRLAVGTTDRRSPFAAGRLLNVTVQRPRPSFL